MMWREAEQFSVVSNLSKLIRRVTCAPCQCGDGVYILDRTFTFVFFLRLNIFFPFGSSNHILHEIQLPQSFICLKVHFGSTVQPYSWSMIFLNIQLTIFGRPSSEYFVVPLLSSLICLLFFGVCFDSFFLWYAWRMSVVEPECPIHAKAHYMEGNRQPWLWNLGWHRTTYGLIRSGAVTRRATTSSRLSLKWSGIRISDPLGDTFNPLDHLHPPSIYVVFRCPLSIYSLVILYSVLFLPSYETHNLCLLFHRVARSEN